MGLPYISVVGAGVLIVRAVLVRVSMAVKRHHDHSNSLQRKTFNWDWLKVQRVSPLSSGREAW